MNSLGRPLPDAPAPADASAGGVCVSPVSASQQGLWLLDLLLPLASACNLARIARLQGALDVADKLGWVRWFNDTVRIHRLPGGHGDLVKPPVVRELAARLQACIDRVSDG